MGTAPAQLPEAPVRPQPQEIERFAAYPSFFTLLFTAETVVAEE
jgi:hypothetical protein